MRSSRKAKARAAGTSYTAEIEEAAELREQAREPISADAKEEIWLWAAAVGLLLVLTAPLLIGARSPSEPQQPDTGQPTVPGPTVAQ